MAVTQKINEALNNELISFLIDIAVYVIIIVAILFLITKAYSDWKKEGLSGIKEEAIGMLIIVGVVIFLFYAGGLATILSLIVTVVSKIFELIGSFIEGII